MFNWLIFNSPINKSDFDIYHTVTILNVPQAFEEPVYIWRILEYQFPLLFLEIVRAIFKVKLVNFQNWFWHLLYQKTVFEFTRKASREP